MAPCLFCRSGRFQRKGHQIIRWHKIIEAKLETHTLSQRHTGTYTCVMSVEQQLSALSQWTGRRRWSSPPDWDHLEDNILALKHISQCVNPLSYK